MSCTCKENNESIFMPQVAEILDAQMITATENHFKLKLQNGERFDYEPGQIVEAGIFGYGEVPLGLASSPTNGESFDLVVRELGKVTKAMAGLEKGDTMTIRGPLGNGFPVDEFKGKDVLIVAGGIGLCPVRSMIEYILHHRDDFGKFTLFFGAKTPHDLLFEEDLHRHLIHQAAQHHATHLLDLFCPIFLGTAFGNRYMSFAGQRFYFHKYLHHTFSYIFIIDTQRLSRFARNWRANFTDQLLTGLIHTNYRIFRIIWRWYTSITSSIAATKAAFPFGGIFQYFLR